MLVANVELSSTLEGTEKILALAAGYMKEHISAGVPGQAEQPARQWGAAPRCRRRGLHWWSPQCTLQGLQRTDRAFQWALRPLLVFPIARSFLSPLIYPPTLLWGGACAGRVLRRWTISATPICMGNSKSRPRPHKLSATRARGSSPASRRGSKHLGPAWDATACTGRLWRPQTARKFGDLPYTKFGDLPYTPLPTYPIHLHQPTLY